MALRSSISPVPRPTTSRCAILPCHRGWKLNEYGLFLRQAAHCGFNGRGNLQEARTEFIPPELARIAARSRSAAANKLPHLVTRADIRGDLHVHSDWTDGTASIEVMAKAAQARGYEYIALTDHSRRVAMAHGLDPSRLGRHGREIDRLNERLDGLTILKGIEVDILKDGQLDLPDASLAKLDIVVAAVHSYFDLPREEQTARMIRAMNNRRVSIIAHPTGRLIGEREPYDIDMERVIAAARDLSCHLEVNSQPDRLDLNDNYIHAAKQAGVSAGDLHRCAFSRCLRVHTVRHRSSATRLADCRRRDQYEIARGVAQIVAALVYRIWSLSKPQVRRLCLPR